MRGQRSPLGVGRAAWGAGGDEGARRPVGRGGVPVGCPGWARAGGERGGRHRLLSSPCVSPGPQALVAELHRRALVEYVRPLLRGRLRCRSARTRSRVAGRLREDAAQLQRLFRRLVSAARGRGAPRPRETWAPENPDAIAAGGGLRRRPSPNFQYTVTL